MPPTIRSRRINRRALFADLGYTPHPGQWHVHRSTAPRRVLACGVRWGKTKAAAMEGLAAALEPAKHAVGWVVAPTYDLADRVFRELQVTVFERIPHRVVSMKEHERRLIIRNMAGGHSEIRGKTADNPVSLLGEGLDWVIVDEAARLRPHIWESHLSQRLIDKKGWALLISTPRGKGYLYDLFRRGQGPDNDADYESWNLPSWTNPHLDRDVIEAERSRLPERVFAQEYGAQFVEGSGAVFRNVRECATGDLREPAPGESYWAGLDLAKVEDYTVFVVINSALHVVHIDRFHRLDWSLQVARIRAAAERYNHAQILCDVTGVGDPVYEALCAEGCSVDPYPFTSRSKNALVENLALLLEQRQIKLPRPDLFPPLVDELEAFEYSVTDSGNVRTSAPSGQHDDAVMALGLAAWQVRPNRPQPSITWLDGPLFPSRY